MKGMDIVFRNMLEFYVFPVRGLQVCTCFVNQYVHVCEWACMCIFVHEFICTGMHLLGVFMYMCMVEDNV